MKHTPDKLAAVFRALRPAIPAILSLGMLSVGTAADKEPPKLQPITPVEPGLRFARLFNDHMVLQRGMPVKVWGWAKTGETVTVGFASDAGLVPDPQTLVSLVQEELTQMGAELG